jgi:type IV secretory pathway TrbD component
MSDDAVDTGFLIGMLIGTVNGIVAFMAHGWVYVGWLIVLIVVTTAAMRRVKRAQRQEGES